MFHDSAHSFFCHATNISEVKVHFSGITNQNFHSSLNSHIIKGSLFFNIFDITACSLPLNIFITASTLSQSFAHALSFLNTKYHFFVFFSSFSDIISTSTKPKSHLCSL